MNESQPLLRRLQGELYKENASAKWGRRGGVHSRFGKGGNGSSLAPRRIAPSLLEADLRSLLAATSDSTSDRIGKVWD